MKNGFEKRTRLLLRHVSLITVATLMISGCATVSNLFSKGPSSAAQGTVRQSFVIPLGGNIVVWGETSGYNEAFTELQKGNFEESERIARNQLSQSPGEPPAMLALAASLLLMRRIELANYYASRLAENPSAEQASAKNIKGIASMLLAMGTARNEEMDQAAAIFRDALTTSGSQVAAALNLGELELMRGRINDAIAAFDDAANRCNDCRPALYGGGMAALRGRQFDAARTRFKAIVANNDADEFAHYQLALTDYYGFQDNDAAARRLKDLATGAKDSRVQSMSESLLRKIRSPEEPL